MKQILKILVKKMPRILSNDHSRGDTLVEVSIAIAIMGVVITASSALINRGVSNLTNASEHVAIRGQINTQAEYLRYVFETSRDIDTHTGGVAVDIENALYANDDSQISKFENNSDCILHTEGEHDKPGPFYLSIGDDDRIHLNKLSKEPDYNKQLDFRTSVRPTPGDGIWVVGVKHNEGGREESNVGYADFYIRSCWSEIGARSDEDIGKLQTTIRIYLEDIKD